MRNLRNIVCTGLVLGAAFIATSSASATVNPPSHREVVCHKTGSVTNPYVAEPPAKASAHLYPKHEGDIVIFETYPTGAKWNELKPGLDKACGEAVPPPVECPEHPKPKPPPVPETGVPNPAATASFGCTAKGGRVFVDLSNTGDWSAQFTVNDDVVYLGPESTKRIILIPREDTNFRVMVKFGDQILVDKTWKVDCIHPPKCVKRPAGGKLVASAPARVGYRQRYLTVATVKNTSKRTERVVLRAQPQNFRLLRFWGSSRKSMTRVVTLKPGQRFVWRVKVVPTAAASRQWVQMNFSAKFVATPVKGLCAAKPIVRRAKARTYEPPGKLDIGKYTFSMSSR